ncbi:hypothetical protein [Jiella avicenniae]|uniref:Uncharacterized protein n=1 Tax=Jiella avicenniae TaxID=2907202 RepID=A0A9X1P1H8_9HYPH|nr:hypothetical protein [Jiella avicenniae]MCE7028139.1 hypothetical protein [Jiella avicenniae]
MSGKISAGDLQVISDYIGRRTSGYKNDNGDNAILCENIYLNSPGGDFYEALRIMEYIHDAMITTTVRDGERCVSACALIWLGGARPDGHSLDNPHTDRRLAPSAILGFHAPFPVDRGGNFSSFEMTNAFVKAFAVAQQMLATFARYRIPMWFAANLMHADKNGFYYIDTVEKANLIGAKLLVDTNLSVEPSAEQLLRACFNLSHWGKGRSAYLALGTTFSRNGDTYFSFDQYKKMIYSGRLRQLSFKMMDSIQSFIPNTAARGADFLLSQIDARSDSAYQGDETLAFFRFLATRLGPAFYAESPGFLVYRGGENDFPSKWILFPSPGVVGPDDQNIRDRAELCLFAQYRNYGGAKNSGDFYGTEINDTNGPQNLPIFFLGLPANTLLTELLDMSGSSSALNRDIVPNRASDTPRPGWCAGASTKIEVYICSDTILSSLDAEYGSRYLAAKAVNPIQARAIAKQTMVSRNSCLLSNQCIAASYERAISAFGSVSR